MELSVDGTRVFLHEGHWLADKAQANGATVWYAIPRATYDEYAWYAGGSESDDASS